MLLQSISKMSSRNLLHRGIHLGCLEEKYLLIYKKSHLSSNCFTAARLPSEIFLSHHTFGTLAKTKKHIFTKHIGMIVNLDVFNDCLNHQKRQHHDVIHRKLCKKIEYKPSFPHLPSKQSHFICNYHVMSRQVENLPGNIRIQDKMQNISQKSAYSSSGVADLPDLNVPYNPIISDGSSGAIPSANANTIQVTDQVHATNEFNPMDYKNVEIAYDFIVGLNSITGLPWWSTLMLSAVTVRLALFPMAVILKHNQAKLTKITMQVEYEKVMMRQSMSNHALFAETSEKAKEKKLAKFGQQRMALLKDKENCSIARFPASVLIQISALFSCTFAIREMLGFSDQGLALGSGFKIAGMANEGVLWFPNLLLADPFCVLSILTCCSNLFLIEMSLVTMKIMMPQSKMVYMYYGFRLFNVGILPWTIYLPSGVMLYLCTLSLSTLCQMLLLRSPLFLHVMKVPYKELAPKEIPMKTLLMMMKDYYTNNNYQKYSPHQKQLEAWADKDKLDIGQMKPK